LADGKEARERIKTAYKYSWQACLSKNTYMPFFVHPQDALPLPNLISYYHTRHRVLALRTGQPLITKKSAARSKSP